MFSTLLYANKKDPLVYLYLYNLFVWAQSLTGAPKSFCSHVTHSNFHLGMQRSARSVEAAVVMESSS